MRPAAGPAAAPARAVEEPKTPYAVAFFDGQNLFHCAKKAFGHTFPNFDCKALATAICKERGWTLTQVRFYTGVPPRAKDAKWHDFWARKATRMSRAGVIVTMRPLRYADELLEDGSYVSIAREKGIDVRIAVEILRLTFAKALDVALVFSQDQDLAEVAMELREIAAKQTRWIKMASAFPDGPAARGINGTDWIRINSALYNSCLDEVW